MERINAYLSGVILPIALLACSVFFIVRLSGAPFTHMSKFLSIMLKKRSGSGASPIRAVIFALAGTLGVGNIVGVASAISLGGAGALFWMWVSAFMAMILKYSEVVLAVKHRRKRNGDNYGGAQYYMTDLFALKGKSGVGVVFTLVFTALCLLNGFTMGGMIQSNTISEAFEITLEIPRGAVAIGVAITLIIVFLGNGKRIFSLCEKLVPFVSILYTLLCLAVIIKSYAQIPTVICEIISDAFNIRAAGGGALGFFMSRALRYGTIRGLFSNEAGCGTAPTAHATSDTDAPCEQGFLGMLEVFIDTIVVCTLTAFVLLLNKDCLKLENPINTVLSAFELSLGEASGVLIALSLFFFALATIICWGYYGKECIYFVCKNCLAHRIYFVFFILAVSAGAYISLDGVWQAADLAIGLMTPMNLITLIFMNKEIVNETKQYFKK